MDLVLISNLMYQNEKTQGQGEEWVGVVMSQLNPRIGELGASVLNSRVEPVVQVPFSTYIFQQLDNIYCSHIVQTLSP